MSAHLFAEGATRATGATGLLLDRVVEMLRRYVILPGDAEYLTAGLFVLHTWAIEAAYTTPYIVVQSAEKRSGKTRVLEVLELLVREPMQVASATEATLYRTIEATGCTLLLDEVDAIFSQNTDRAEALRGLLNSGNRRSGRMIRCVGPNQEPKTFSTFCAKVLAGIDEGRLPHTIADRAIELRMKRKLPHETVERLRHKTAVEAVRPLREALDAWAHEHVGRLELAEPAVPDELDDRSAEAWEPLLAIADLAGAGLDARRAAVALSAGGADDGGGSVGNRLLGHVREVFAGARMSSHDLCAALTANAEWPYGRWSDGAGIDQAALARYLKPYGIKSTAIKFEAGTLRGYKREQFSEAWARYAPSPVAPVARVAPNTNRRAA